MRSPTLFEVLGPLPWLSLVLLGTSCLADYSDAPPPSLDDVPALDSATDTLVFERQLRWWSPPTAQRIRVYQRDDGTLLMLRAGWDGEGIYGWTEAELTAAGTQRLADALAAVDLSATAPAPGDYGCTYSDTLAAVVFVEGEAVEYLSLCPPAGVADLVALWEDVVELGFECPGDDSWFVGEVPIAQLDCAIAG